MMAKLLKQKQVNRQAGEMTAFLKEALDPSSKVQSNHMYRMMWSRGYMRSSRMNKQMDPECNGILAAPDNIFIRNLFFAIMSNYGMFTKVLYILPTSGNHGVTTVTMLIAASEFIGCILGGYFGDVTGRRKAVNIGATLMAFGSGMASLIIWNTPLLWGENTVISPWDSLCIWLMISAIGAMLMLPPGLTLCAESTTNLNREYTLCLGFFFQAIGGVICEFIFYVLASLNLTSVATLSHEGRKAIAHAVTNHRATDGLDLTEIHNTVRSQMDFTNVWPLVCYGLALVFIKGLIILLVSFYHPLNQESYIWKNKQIWLCDIDKSEMSHLVEQVHRQNLKKRSMSVVLPHDDINSSGLKVLGKDSFDDLIEISDTPPRCGSNYSNYSIPTETHSQSSNRSRDREENSISPSRQHDSGRRKSSDQLDLIFHVDASLPVMVSTSIESSTQSSTLSNSHHSIPLVPTYSINAYQSPNSHTMASKSHPNPSMSIMHPSEPIPPSDSISKEISLSLSEESSSPLNTSRGRSPLTSSSNGFLSRSGPAAKSRAVECSATEKLLPERTSMTRKPSQVILSISNPNIERYRPNISDSIPVMKTKEEDSPVKTFGPSMALSEHSILVIKTSASPSFTSSDDALVSETLNPKTQPNEFNGFSVTQEPVSNAGARFSQSDGTLVKESNDLTRPLLPQSSAERRVLFNPAIGLYWSSEDDSDNVSMYSYNDYEEATRLRKFLNLIDAGIRSRFIAMTEHLASLCRMNKVYFFGLYDYTLGSGSMVMHEIFALMIVPFMLFLVSFSTSKYSDLFLDLHTLHKNLFPVTAFHYQLLLSLLSLPAYIVSATTLIYYTPKLLQLVSLVCSAFIYFGLALSLFGIDESRITDEHGNPIHLEDFYYSALAYDAIFQFGLYIPMITSYIMPIEGTHTRLRSTILGLSMAMARLGTLMGIWIALFLLSEESVSRVIVLLVVCFTSLIMALISKANIPAQHVSRYDMPELHTIDLVLDKRFPERKKILLKELAVEKTRKEGEISGLYTLTAHSMAARLQ